MCSRICDNANGHASPHSLCAPSHSGKSGPGPRPGARRYPCADPTGQPPPTRRRGSRHHHPPLVLPAGLPAEGLPLVCPARRQPPAAGHRSQRRARRRRQHLQARLAGVPEERAAQHPEDAQGCAACAHAPRQRHEQDAVLQGVARHGGRRLPHRPAGDAGPLRGCLRIRVRARRGQPEGVAQMPRPVLQPQEDRAARPVQPRTQADAPQLPERRPPRLLQLLWLPTWGRWPAVEAR
mmetsp:Transcript_1394/g.3258  ORF Transcript_1394/g.3258 Transcript_1394/m.3258 type:complete len:237 (+) Transcript_1394:927-1637(+)